MVKGLRRLQPGQSKKRPRISIVISARNEEGNIKYCLDSITSQDYPDFEILIANDRSTDNTQSIVENFISQNPQANIKLLNIEEADKPPQWSPKKFALKKLIEMSSGEIILTTDADCQPPAGWASHMIKEFKEGVELVAGFSFYEKIKGMNHIFYQLQALEFFSHMAVASGAICQQFPITSSGTSLGYRKKWFLEVNGFDDISNQMSGDDDFLLHKLSNQNPSAIRFCWHEDARVITFPAPTVNALWNQRKRWASKTPDYPKKVVWLLGFVFAFYLTILISLIWGTIQVTLYNNWLDLYAAFGVWGIKTALDYWVMEIATEKFKQEHLMMIFLPTAILHIPLIIGAVTFGTLGSFVWKEHKSK